MATSDAQPTALTGIGVSPGLVAGPVARMAPGIPEPAIETLPAGTDLDAECVLSTLHTNDAPTTLTRMRNMGIAPFNIASSVILITAQRLARRLCPKCKEPTDIPNETLLEAGFTEEDLDGSWTPYKPVGCDACNNGYKGRVGIYQVMPISEEMQRIILADGSALEISDQAPAFRAPMAVAVIGDLLV